MKLVVNRDVLSESVSFAVKLLPQRAPMPILSGVLLNATTGALTVSSFDYEVSARATIDADVVVPGAVLVSGRLLADIASKLPAATVNLEVTDDKLVVTSGSAKFGLFKMLIEEYPSLPTVDQWQGHISAEDFSNAVSQVAVAASRDDVTPVITGVELEAKADSLSLIATDRYRVAIKGIAWEYTGTETNALVPARTISELAKTFGSDGDISVSITQSDERSQIAFSAGQKVVTSLLIKGNFPPVRRLFPENIENYAVLNRTELIEATRRVSLVLDREAPLRFNFSLDGLELEAIGSEQAQAQEQIEAFLTGDNVSISLKPQFLLDALGAIHTELVQIAFTSLANPNKPGPVLISGQVAKDAATADDYKYLLQPNLLLR